MRNNECLIDWLRFSVPNTDAIFVAENILGISITEFSNVGKGSPFPTYDARFCFANIELHISSTHSNILVNLSGTACRQYEEYMSKTSGWHWQAFIFRLLEMKASPTRIDLALDIFDNSSPSVKKIQDYVKRGQLSSRAQTFREINSGSVLDGSLKGFTLYIGTHPQMLRIYDKKQEIRDNTGEILNLDKWVRWELELGDRKALQACQLIANGVPLNTVIKGILASHYSFKTQPKGKKSFRNKSRWNNMRWWENFINSLPKIPLRIAKEKKTMAEKKLWLEKATAKSLAMVYESYKLAYGEDFAKAYIEENLSCGKKKFTTIDRSMIEQSVNELLGEKEI